MKSYDLAKLICQVSDLDDLVEKVTLNSIVEFNRVVSIEIVEKYLGSKTEELELLIKQNTRIGNLISRQFRSDKEQVLMNLGFFKGATFLTELLMNEKEEEQRSELDIKKHLAYKHTKNILVYLYKHPSVRHKELAFKLDVSPSGLTEILKPLIEDGIVEKTPQSKYSYYSLSEYAHQYTKNNLIGSSINTYNVAIYQDEEGVDGIIIDNVVSYEVLGLKRKKSYKKLMQLAY